MIIERYVFDIIDSNMYVCIEDKEALIIDPFKCEIAKKRLLDSGVNKVFIILTHEHLDHISGANYYSEFNPIVYAGEKCKNIVENRLRKLKVQFASIFIMANDDEKRRVSEFLKDIYEIKIDRALYDGEHIAFGKHLLTVVSAQGHSQGSIVVFLDKLAVFTGDSLLPDREVITDLPGGSKTMYEAVTIPILQRINREAVVYPGHGEVTLFVNIWR